MHESIVFCSTWQVTLCDLIWHVISSSGVVISITNCYIRFTLLTYLLTFNKDDDDDDDETQSDLHATPRLYCSRT